MVCFLCTDLSLVCQICSLAVIWAIAQGEQSQLVQASFLLLPACQMCLLHVIRGPVQDEYKMEPGTVIAADFYHANTLMPLSHEEIVSKVKSNLDHCEPSFRSAQVEYKLKSLQNAGRAAYTE